MAHHELVVAIPAENLDEAFKLAAQQLSFRQGEVFSNHVSDVLASEWAAKIMSRHLGWNIYSQLYPPNSPIYDSYYHNQLIQLGVDRRLLTQAMELMTGRLIHPEMSVGLRYQHRSIYLTILSPEN